MGTIAAPAALTPVDYGVSTGLAAETRYTVVLVAEDDEAVPNLQATVRAIEVVTLPDTTPPQWAAGFPTAQRVEDFGFHLVLQLDEPCSCAYVTLYAGTGTPTVVDVVAGTDGDGTPAVAAGVASVVEGPDGTFASDERVHGGLAAETQYDVHVVCWDHEATTNRQTHAGTTSLTTLPDATPPVFVPGFPRVAEGSVEDFAVELQVALDEPGSWYFVIQPLGSEVPTASEIMAGGGQAVAASDFVSVLVDRVSFVRRVSTGLSAETAFQVCSVAADDQPSPNAQPQATVFNFTTLPDTTPPEWTSSPSFSRVEDFTLGVTVVLDEPGSILWLIARAGALPPTVTGLRAGRDGGGLPAVDTGRWAVVGGQVATTVVISGKLQAETSYDVFVVAEVSGACAASGATTPV